MRLIGTIVHLQVQRSSLKLGERPRRWFEPAPLLTVPALELSAAGVVGLTDGGGRVIDVHNRDHPASRHGDGNGISIGFTSHYAHMRQRFGDTLADGIAGENILVQTERTFCQGQLPATLLVETAAGPVHLGGSRVIEPCVEFSRYALGFRGPPAHDLATPAEHDAATPDELAPATPSRPDPVVKATLVFLRQGLRGYCATSAHGPTVVRVGARLYTA
jgi:hypothetical protein